MEDKKKGRSLGDKNTTDRIEHQKATRIVNIKSGKPTTMNGWKRPGQNRGGRPRKSEDVIELRL